MEDQISKAEEFAKLKMKDYDGGHDWQHIMRVRALAKYINDEEKLTEPFLLDLTAILHDVADSKFNRQADRYAEIKVFLKESGLDDVREQIVEVIRNISFSNKHPRGNLEDPLLLVLQDADRLDAIGAVGVARAFSYGGFIKNPVYLPPGETGILPPSTIAHFYDKLLKLKDLMNTPTGKRMAEERHLFLEIFLRRFYSELKLK